MPANPILQEGPIEEHYLKIMNDIGRAIDEIFNGVNCPLAERKTGFVLMVFNTSQDFDGAPGGRFNYLSNCERVDVIACMKEIIARNEGRSQPAPVAVQ